MDYSTTWKEAKVIKRENMKIGDYGMFCDSPIEPNKTWIRTIKCYNYQGFVKAYEHLRLIGIIRNGLFYYTDD